MAKKPGQVKPQKPLLKTLIKKYIQKDGVFKAENKNPNLEFGFLFHHPQQLGPNGNPQGLLFQANKPKKEDFIVLSTKVNVSPEHVKILEAGQKKKHKLYQSLIKLFLLKNVEHQVNIKDNYYIIHKRIFLNHQKLISRKDFYNSLRKLFTANLHAIVLVQEAYSRDFDLDNFSGSTLYT